MNRCTRAWLWVGIPTGLATWTNGCGDAKPTDPSAELSFLVAPTAPSNIRAVAVASDTIVVSWADNSSNESGFEVYRSTTGSTGSFSLRVRRPANATRFRDSQVTPLKSYCYKVRAFRTVDGATSYSAYSSVACATPGSARPAAPSGLVARPITSAIVRTTWNDQSSNEEGFRVQRSTDGGATWSTAGTTVADYASFDDPGRSAEQPVCYRAVSFNEHGSSAPSNADCTTPPAKPTTLTASVTPQGSIDLTWADRSSVEDGYQVQRSSDGSAFSIITNLAVNTTSYSDAAPTTNATYWYRVRARKDGGFSSFSNVASVTRTGDVRVTAATTGLDLDPDGYTVAVSLVTPTGLVPVASNGVNPNGSVTFSGLRAGDSYRLTLSGIATNCAAGANPQTITAVAGTTTDVGFGLTCVAIAIPVAPSLNDVAGYFLGTMWLQWSDGSNNEDGFKIERCQGDCGEADFVLVTITSPNVTSYQDFGLLDGTYYTYRLRATNRAGDSAPSIRSGRTCSEELDWMAPCY